MASSFFASCETTGGKLVEDGSSYNSLISKQIFNIVNFKKQLKMSVFTLNEQSYNLNILVSTIYQLFYYYLFITYLFLTCNIINLYLLVS